MTNLRRAPLVGLIVVLSVALGACAAGAASPAPESDETGRPTTPPSEQPIDDGDGTVVSPPNDGGNDGGGNDGGGGGLPGDPGQPQLVVPQSGQLMVHPVAIAELLARVEGRSVTLNARWWSGVEPCSVLDSVTIDRDGSTITIGLHEGTSDLDAVCIAIAVEKVTVIDLGELDPGTYTIVAASGDAAAITVEVS
ncbi:MAG TPA: hypothetical protein VFR14_08695 [Candidatus Limnocylindrales bacterium]|nr:hypothetical protein [Candidatus Limnocylindrales bacterium]